MALFPYQNDEQDELDNLSATKQQEVPMLPADQDISPPVSPAPAAAPVAPIAPVVAPPAAPQPEQDPGLAAPVDHRDQILSEYRKLMADRKKEMEHAENRQFNAEVWAALGNSLPGAVAGATAMNTKAHVKAPELNKITVDDLTAKVQNKYKPDLDSLLQQYKSITNRDLEKAKIDYMKRQGDYLAKKGDKADDKEEKPTEGIKSLDRTFGKHYDEWTSTGHTQVQDSLKKLEDAKASLLASQKDLVSPTGRFSGRLPDWAKSEEAIRLRDDVHSTALAGMRAAMGPQFTEKEGEQFKGLAYNEKLSPEENIRKIDMAIKKIQDQTSATMAKAKHFEDNKGTLQGFKYSAPAAEEKKDEGGDNAELEANAEKYAKMHALPLDQAREIMKKRMRIK
jgi:hypothetical protein